MSEEIKEVPKELPLEKSELELLKEQLADKNNKLLRALADFDNYKKRVALEQDQFVKFANEGLIKELLPALDGLSKAIEISKDDNLTKGLALIKRQIMDALAHFGIEEIEAQGKPYDPNVHEAIMKKDSAEPENTIIEEVQKGYILHGRVIRPSMVILGKKGAK